VPVPRARAVSASPTVNFASPRRPVSAATLSTLTPAGRHAASPVAWPR
jgi:hypothetical protein